VNDEIEPADAARALSEISRQREQVIRREATSRRHVWAVAVLTIGYAAFTDSHPGALRFWIVTVLFTAGFLVIGGLELSRQRRARLHPGLVPPGAARIGLAGQAAIVAVMVGVALGTSLGLEAARVPYPATIAMAAAMVPYVAGNRALTRYYTAFLVSRSGGGR
jgi:hypothetical protein